MNDEVLKGSKLDVYVMLKILKYCTGSSARSYQCKFAVQQVFTNKNIDSMDELGSAIKEIIHFNTIRGKFSSVHPDLAAEGITRVEVGEEGLHFFRDQQPGELPHCYQSTHFSKLSVDEPEEKKGMVTLVVTIEKELLKRIDANVQPNLEAEGITSKVEVEAPTKNEPG